MLKNLLGTFNSKTAFLPMQLPKTLHIEKELRRLERITEAREEKKIAKVDINQILQRWLDKEPLSIRDKKSLLFAGMEKFESYPNLKPLWDEIVDEIKESDKASFLKAALFAFYQSYGSDYAKSIQSILGFKIDAFPPKLSNGLRENHVFDTKGPQVIAEMILESDTALNDLKTIKLSGLLFSSKFMLEVFKYVAVDMSRHGYEDEELKRFKTFFFSLNDRGQETPSLMSQENIYAKGLLGYWDSHTPSKELKEYLKHFFLSNFRDPRAYPQRWQAVDENYQKIIKRWLTEESFEMLIQVLDAVADPGHWNDRKDFWSYYLKNEFISDSWVIFGTEAHMQAQKLQREGLLSKSAGFAKFRRSSGSVQSSHSVIIMKIGEMVISEWTHSGRVRMFINHSVKAPEFYKAEYSANHIRHDGYRLSSQYSSYGNEVFLDHHSNWQIKVAEFIRKHTGISHEILKKGYN
jgi:hypothetical protein